MASLSSVPQTVTTSYADDERRWRSPSAIVRAINDYATSVCNAFATLGARGVSLFFGSGDDGVGTGDCETNTGTKAVRFQPMFPASCT
jgi:tripeptidyl-peptidase-1